MPLNLQLNSRKRIGSRSESKRKETVIKIQTIIKLTKKSVASQFLLLPEGRELEMQPAF